MPIQSILIPKKKFSRKQADSFARRHGQINKVDITDNFYRYRQAEPLTASQKNLGWYYVTDELANGIKLIRMLNTIGN